MATIWTFGDSLTERYNPIFKWSKDYIDWKGYVPKVYGNFISEMLNYDLKNLGKAGCDNYTIFETLCNNYHLIKDEDIIIIGWTSVGRFRLANNQNNWLSLVPNFSNYLDGFKYISKNTIDEIFINRENIKYTNEVNSWIKFINTACINKKILHWSTIKGTGELDTFYFFEMESITKETNGLVNDAHFSENGQNQLANEMLNIIFTNNFGIKRNKLI